MQHELKFYKAFREDAELAERLLDEKNCSPRHIISLLHDSLEFLFYECLLLNEIDVYENGQNTIGFDKAYNAPEQRERAVILALEELSRAAKQ